MSSARHSRAARWQAGFDHLVGFRAEHGHVRVPARHVSADGYRLGQWVWVQRVEARAGRLNSERARALRNIGFAWDGRAARTEAMIAAVERLARRSGPEVVGRLLGDDLVIDDLAVAPLLREAQRHGRLDDDQQRRLADAGFAFAASDAYFARAIAELAAFAAEFGHAAVPARHVTPAGCHLGDWLRRMRAAWRAGSLDEARANALRQHGVRA